MTVRMQKEFAHNGKPTMPRTMKNKKNCPWLSKVPLIGLLDATDTLSRHRASCLDTGMDFASEIYCVVAGGLTA